MRKKIFSAIEPRYYSGRISLYNILLVAVILVSAAPLVCKEREPWFRWPELAAAVFFLLDHILRWSTADYKKHSHTRRAFLTYPLMTMALIDGAAAAAYLILVLFPALAETRWLMLLRIFGVMKLMRYLSSKVMAKSVLIRQKKQLLAVCLIAVEYIVITALIVFNAEPETFGTFFDAIYWATISLTTVGYGDIYPVSTAGHIITMLSSFFGIAIIALPAGIITAGIMHELNRDHSDS